MRQPVRPRSVPAPVTITPTFVQAKTANSSTSSVASQAVTLDTGATAGNLLLVAANSDATLTAPSGFSLAESEVSTAGLYLWWKIAAGGETTFTVTPSVSDTVAMVALEYSGIAASPVDVTADDSAVGSTVGPVTAGATATTAQAVELVIAVTGPHSFADSAAPTSPTWTNSYTTRGSTASAHATNAINVAVFVGELVTSSAGAQSTSTSWTNSANDWGALIVAFKGA